MRTDVHEDGEATPDLDGLQQLDDGGLRVPVRLDQVVPVHMLPSRCGAHRSYAANESDAAPTLLLGKDLRRRRATIISIDAPIWVGAADDVTTGNAAVWPAGGPLVIEHTDQVYARPTVGSSLISVIPEQWAD